MEENEKTYRTTWYIGVSIGLERIDPEAIAMVDCREWYLVIVYKL